MGLVEKDVKYYSLVNGMKNWGCRSVVQLLPSMPEALGSVFTAAVRREERKGGKGNDMEVLKIIKRSHHVVISLLDVQSEEL